MQLYNKMPNLDLNQTVSTNYSGLAQHSISSVTHETPIEQKEFRYMNDRWQKDWTYFNRIAKLRSAIIMKAIWTVGKGYEADTTTKVTLDHIDGNGKETFEDILFNMVITKQVGRDAFAEIIRDEDTGTLLNLRLLDPGSIQVIFDKAGRIIRYEQIDKENKKTWKREEIFHLSHNRFSGEIHGRSIPETVEEIILADDENFKIMKRLTKFQAVPFLIFKVKSDDPTTIANFKTNIRNARNKGEDLIIPDDENLLSWEVVQVNPSAVLIEWRNNVNSEFYRAVGMPLILFGSAGTTESGGKIEYLGHETVFEHDQKEIEQQIFSQLGIKINLISPTSLLENLQKDETKDKQNAVNFQQNDVQAGVGA